MNKRWIVLAMVFLFVAGFSAEGSAYSFSDLYSVTCWEPERGFNYGTTDFGAGLGTYIGTGSLSNYGNETVLDFFRASGFDDVEQMAINFTGIKQYAGTWSVANPMNASNFVDYLIIKGAKTFSVHQYNPAATYGIWNVGYLADAGNSGKPPVMSFVRAYNTSTQVPEPAGILLLGMGMVSLGIYRRITKKK